LLKSETGKGPGKKNSSPTDISKTWPGLIVLWNFWQEKKSENVLNFISKNLDAKRQNWREGETKISEKFLEVFKMFEKEGGEEYQNFNGTPHAPSMPTFLEEWVQKIRVKFTRL
jgi:hypothetical protein